MNTYTYKDSYRTYHVIFNQDRVCTIRASSPTKALSYARVQLPNSKPLEVLVCTEAGLVRLEGVL